MSPETVVVKILKPDDAIVLATDTFTIRLPTYDATKLAAVAVAVPAEEITAPAVTVIATPSDVAAVMPKFRLFVFEPESNWAPLTDNAMPLTVPVLPSKKLSVAAEMEVADPEM